MGFVFSWIPAVERGQFCSEQSQSSASAAQTENLFCWFGAGWVSDPGPHAGGVGPAAPSTEGKHHLPVGF